MPVKIFLPKSNENSFINSGDRKLMSVTIHYPYFFINSHFKKGIYVLSLYWGMNTIAHHCKYECSKWYEKMRRFLLKCTYLTLYWLLFPWKIFLARELVRKALNLLFFQCSSFSPLILVIFQFFWFTIIILLSLIIMNLFNFQF